MKRILCLFLILCSFAGICGCASEQKPPENSVKVYYERDVHVYGASDGVIAPYYLDATGHEQDYSYLVDRYLRTNPGEGFAPTFPNDLYLAKFKLEGLTAKVVLSDRIADLTGMDLTIALTCLAHTVMSITGCQEVIVRALSRQLDGQNFITLNRDSYLLIDESGAALD